MKRATILIAFGLLVVTALAVAFHKTSELKMKKIANPDIWLREKTASEVRQTHVPASEIASVGLVLNAFAGERALQFRLRKMHPTMPWYFIDIWSDSYKITVTNPVHVEDFHIYGYFNIVANGTKEGLSALVDGAVKRILSIQGAKNISRVVPK